MIYILQYIGYALSQAKYTKINPENKITVYLVSLSTQKTRIKIQKKLHINFMH